MDSGLTVHNAMVSTVFFLGATCVAVPLFKKLGLGSILGYLTAGVLVGPFGFQLFADPKSIMHFAEIGVVFLLFVIGLELNLTKLWSMRRDVFGLGSLQVLMTGLMIGGLLFFTPILGDIQLSVAILMGATLSLSSTAFAIQIMKERNELQTPHGQSAFSILLFQDLAVIPLLAIVPMLVGDGLPKELSSMVSPMVKATGSILAVVFVGRYLFRHILRIVAQSQAKEVFTALSLLLVIGVSLVMDSVGLSMALGAFLSGVILADSEYRHELETDIEPFKGLLLGLFFMSVGMNINLDLVVNQPVYILALTLGLMGLKCVALFGVSRLMKLSSLSSKMIAVLLCQSGEFGFVIFGLPVSDKVFGARIVETLTLVITFSMALTPLALFIFERFKKIESTDDSKSYDTEFELDDPKVIIAGYGRFGQIVARILMMRKIPFTALDHSPDNVHTALKFGYKIYYGDAARLDLLNTAGVAKAKVFLIAVDNVEVSLNIAETLKHHYPNLKVYARARNRQHVFDLIKAGAKVIHREVFASSLNMAEDILNELGFEQTRAKLSVDKFKKHDEELLQTQFEYQDDEKLFINKTREMNAQLEELLKNDTELSS